jgi:hypothetical protein
LFNGFRFIIGLRSLVFFGTTKKLSRNLPVLDLQELSLMLISPAVLTPPFAGHALCHIRNRCYFYLGEFWLPKKLEFVTLFCNAANPKVLYILMPKVPQTGTSSIKQSTNFKDWAPILPCRGCRGFI